MITGKSPTDTTPFNYKTMQDHMKFKNFMKDIKHFLRNGTLS